MNIIKHNEQAEAETAHESTMHSEQIKFHISQKYNNVDILKKLVLAHQPRPPVLALYDPFGVDVPLNLDITHSLTNPGQRAYLYPK